MGGNTLLAILGIVGALFGIVGLVGAGFAVLRARGLTATYELFEKANAELRQQNDDLRAADERHRAECASQIADLNGKVSVLQGGIVRDVAEGVATATARGLAQEVSEAVRHGFAEAVEQMR